MKRLMGTSNDVALTICEWFWEWCSSRMAAKNAGMFGGFGFNGTMGAFSIWECPLLSHFLISARNSLAGWGLIFGLLTRIAAFGVGGLMVGAIFMVHMPYGFL